jgi:TolB-like protein/class 3 adenylate cyclase
MAEERVQRRLAAILAADVVGYSRLMERDEAGTMAVLKTRRTEVLKPLVARHQGRIFKFTGDGVLVEFGSAVNAVQCAIDLQHGMVAANAALPEGRRIVLRIGINLGDVMVEGSDLYGDGVNVAARLESLAEPGDICVSGSVYDQVKRKLEFGFDELGPQTIKNIADPVHVYRVRAGSLAERKHDGAGQESLALPAKPSIAVLPFTNISADADQEFFADGLTEDLITELSKAPGLFVIARHSSFAFKNKPVDVRRVAQDLGVRYILEGSARRASGRIRINAQLIDAREGGGHLWAERFDRDLADVFAVQDEVIGKIVEALVGKLTAEGLRERYRPANLEAYDLCLRGRAQWAHSTESGVDAIPLFERAIVLDPAYAEAYRWLALGQSIGWLHMNRPMDPFRQLSMVSAKKAVELDPENSGAHWVLAFVLLYERRWEESANEFEISLRLNPNDADAWAALADLKVMEGLGAEAVSCVEKALRLNPSGPYYWDLGQAQYAAGQYEAAAKTLRNEATYRTGSRRFLAAALAQLGRLEEAREEGRLYLARNPHFRISYWVETQPFRDLATRDRIVEGYRKAGLPE